MGFFDSFRGLFSRTKTPVTKPAGSDGVWAPGGYLFGGEVKAALQGNEKWLTYDKTVANCITVASAIRIWNALHGQAEWACEPNPLGGSKAKACAAIVTEGLIEAQMSRPWKRVVVKCGFGATFKGFAMFEHVVRRRSDGKIITADLQHRPQYTIERWDKPDEQSQWVGVEQRTKSGSTYYLERERLFYVVDDSITDQPDGVGVLRHLVEHARRVERYEQLEGWGFEGDLRGMPVAYAPIKALAAAAVAAGVPQNDTAAIKAYVDAQTKFLRDILEKHIKSPDLSLMLDSEPYMSLGQDATPSASKKWAFDVVKSQAAGQSDVRNAINAVNRELLRVMCCEWLLMGDGEGARAVHEDKTAMFGMVLNGSLENIGDAATSGPARRLTALNGFDADTCTPRVKPMPIPLETVEAACRALQLIAQAGDPLRPNDDAPDILRKRMKLPPRPEMTPELEGMLPEGRGRGPAVDPSPAGGPPDPSKGEVEVEVDDEEPRKPVPKRGRKR